MKNSTDEEWENSFKNGTSGRSWCGGIFTTIIKQEGEK